MYKRLFIISILAISSYAINAQKATQTIRGIVSDKDSKTSLIGVAIVLPGSNPLIGGTTDANGEFVIAKVPVGRQNIQFTYFGYKSASLENVEVNAGKEVVLAILLEESVTAIEEVSVVGSRNKTQALNDMSAISSRTFSVEETGRYAGSRNDVSRMAANYAGVTNGDDSRNDIVIRGNSPIGLLWKLEEMEIPSPSHFSGVGSNGGPVSMLNYNVIANSDFMTGAFAAEYGNASSGVFDIKLRQGNNHKREYMLQAGALGTELMLEGPFKSGYKGSYLINYRLSTTSIMTMMGIKFGYSGQADYQDASFNIHLPVGNKLDIGVFGMGGRSIYKVLYKDKTDDDFSPDAYINTNSHFITATGAAGTSLQYRISDNTYLKTVLGISGVGEKGVEDSVGLVNYETYPSYRSDNYLNKITTHTYLKSKLNARNKLKLGFISTTSLYQMNTKAKRETWSTFQPMFTGKGDMTLLETYVQWAYSFTDKLIMNNGLHHQFLALNNSNSIEPRTSLKWNFMQQQSLSIGYGLHSQTQIVPLYFVATQSPNGKVNTNQELDFNKSHQLVLGYNNLITAKTALKAEVYYQHLFNIPVTRTSSPSSFSGINEGMSYWLTDEDSLVNKGQGRNFGIELTLERFFNKGFYYLVTASLYDSRYKGSDNVWRNTAFNGHYVLNVLAGKEFKVNETSKLLFDLKLTTAGGKRYTPIDFESSRDANQAIRIENEAYSKQFDSYFRGDVKVTYRFQGLGKTQEVFVNIDNVFNNKNVFTQNYNARTNQLGYIYQLGIFPTFQYKIFF